MAEKSPKKEDKQEKEEENAVSFDNQKIEALLRFMKFEWDKDENFKRYVTENQVLKNREETEVLKRSYYNQNIDS